MCPKSEKTGLPESGFATGPPLRAGGFDLKACTPIHMCWCNSCGQREGDAGASPGVVAGGDRPAVAVDDATTDRQAESNANSWVARLWTVEVVEDGFVFPGRNPDASVSDMDADPPVTVRFSGDVNPGRLSSGGVLMSIGHQAIDQLPNHASVGVYGRQVADVEGRQRVAFHTPQ